jgi:hypothetical protein
MDAKNAHLPDESVTIITQGVTNLTGNGMPHFVALCNEISY